MANPAGEPVDGPLRLDFDRCLKLEFHGSGITTDAGWPAMSLRDPRTGKNGRHAMTGLFRQSIFGRLGGHEDVSDAGRPGCDPAMRWIVGGRAVAGQAACAVRMGRLETEFLAGEENFPAPADLSGQWIDRVYARHPPRAIMLDMDSMAIRNAADFVPATPTAPTVGAAFCNPSSSVTGNGTCAAVSEAMPPSPHRTFPEAKGDRYTIGLKADAILRQSIACLPTRPVGRPAGRVVAFCNRRGAAGQHIKEGRNAIVRTRLSCRRFRNNAVRLRLHTLACNPGNLMRTPGLPEAVRRWSPTGVKEKPIRIVAGIVTHGRYVTFRLSCRPARTTGEVCPDDDEIGTPGAIYAGVTVLAVPRSPRRWSGVAGVRPWRQYQIDDGRHPVNVGSVEINGYRPHLATRHLPANMAW